jgi:hypothetical protein
MPHGPVRLAEMGVEVDQHRPALHARRRHALDAEGVGADRREGGLAARRCGWGGICSPARKPL